MSTQARFNDNGIAIDVIDTTKLPKWAKGDADAFITQLYGEDHGFIEVPDEVTAGSKQTAPGVYLPRPAKVIPEGPVIPTGEVVGDLRSVPVTAFLDNLLLDSELDDLLDAEISAITATEKAARRVLHRFRMDRDGLDLTSATFASLAVQLVPLLAGTWRLAQIAAGQAPTETDPG